MSPASTTAMALTSQTPLLALPSELVETILICSCSPRTVVSIAQTCRTLRTLVYASPDSHLWRELFLITWDDPRPTLEHYALVDPRIDPTDWDWGVEYRNRVTAEKWLKAWRRDICLAEEVPDKGTDVEWYSSALSALSAVLNTLLTLNPFPLSPPIALRVLSPTISSFPTGNIGSGVGDRGERLTSAPPLPPLLIMLASGFSAFQKSKSAARLGRLVYGPHASRALVAEPPVSKPIPIPALPPQLMRTLLPSLAVGVRGLPAYAPFLSGADHWGDDPLGDVFHRIICITGFAHIPPPLVPTSPKAIFKNAQSSTETQENGHDIKNAVEAQEIVEQHEDAEGNGYLQESTSWSKVPEPKPFPTPSKQYEDARTLARRRTYDMRYLRGDRLWGPFRIVTKESLNIRPEASDQDLGLNPTHYKSKCRSSVKNAASRYPETRRLGTFAWAMGADIEPDDFDSTSSEDDSDEDWHDVIDGGAERSSSAEGRRENDDADMDGVDVEPEHPLISLILASTVTTDAESMNPVSAAAHPRTSRSHPRLLSNSTVSPSQIKARHLRPDYAYLASVRIVVEANLKELFGRMINDDAERSADQVRSGGVSMFWEDEEEILRARNEQLQSGPPTTTPTENPPSNDEARTFELGDILSHFENLEVARLGGSCGYWSGWLSRAMKDSDDIPDPSSAYDIGARKPRIVARRGDLEKQVQVTSAIEDKGKGKGKGRERSEDAAPAMLGDWEVGPEGEACEGWDWVGVAGIWRRCVCWMDYRELLCILVAYRAVYNLDSTKFLTHEMQEACRIIPMELRITGYTRAGLIPINRGDSSRDHVFPGNYQSSPKSKAGRTGYFRPPPVIHFTGSSTGSDRASDDGRTVRGSVQLIGGGEVRWQMESTVPGTLTPEWSSEAVQMGGLGSAVGVLGMWTGARHERADPLGPFWAWKVA